MVGKDQAIGGAIFIVCAIVAILYIVFLFGIPYMTEWVPWDPSVVRFWLIATPVFIAFIAIMGIGMWIGWTMATTPPPKPIEEITSELEEKEEDKKEDEEKKKPKKETEK